MDGKQRNFGIMSHITPLPPARPKGADSEKVTINLGFVDLGHIDLLVAEGFYSNRTESSAKFVDNDSSKCFAIKVLSNNHQFFTLFNNFFENR